LFSNVGNFVGAIPPPREAAIIDCWRLLPDLPIESFFDSRSRKLFLSLSLGTTSLVLDLTTSGGLFYMASETPAEAGSFDFLRGAVPSHPLIPCALEADSSLP